MLISILDHIFCQLGAHSGNIGEQLLTPDTGPAGQFKYVTSGDKGMQRRGQLYRVGKPARVELLAAIVASLPVPPLIIFLCPCLIVFELF